MTIGEQIMGVFTDLSEWITTSLSGFTTVFYNAESGLTVIGWCLFGGMGIAVALLLFNMVKSMLRFK